MAITLLTGKISHIDHATETHGQISTRGSRVRGQISAAHAWSFRVDNRPAIYKQKQTASFTEGDDLTAAGEDKNGTFVISACRNETTGAFYEGPVMLILVCGILLVVTVCLFPIGLWALWMWSKMSKASKMVQSTPRRTPA